jgi:excisionase family DNA binding protein
MNQLLTPKEVSNILQINYRRVLDFIHLGKLDAIKIGRDFRIRECDLFDFLKTNSYKSF